MSWAEELGWIYRPPGLKPMVVEHAVTDPVELTQLVPKAHAYGARVVRVDGTTPEGAARLDQLWRTSYAQNGAAPSAWVDTFGNIIVDEAAHPEINTIDVLRGPVPPQPEAAPDHEPDSEADDGGFQVGTYSTEMARAIQGPAEANRAFWAETDARHFVAMTKDPDIYRFIWQSQFAQPGEPPPAFYDSAGTLHVDINRVDIQNRPR
jgi:hypothetical protein